MAANKQEQVNAYILGLGVASGWQNCHECGTCSKKKIKCFKNQYELHLNIYGKFFQVFEGSKNIMTGTFAEIPTLLNTV